MINFNSKRFYKKTSDKKLNKESEKLKNEELSEREQRIIQQEEQLKTNSELFDDTIHEINKIYTLLENNTYKLRNAYDSSQFDDFFDNILKDMEGNVSLLSIRLQLHRYLMNPSLTEKDQTGKFVIWKKVEKIYKCLYAEKAKKNLSIDMTGSNTKSFKLKNTIEIAIFIIIENAIKYSPNNEVITINFVESKNNLVVSFTNWGTCPSDEEMTRLTERGFRSNITRQNPTIKGSGLGLYILEQICKSNGVDLNITKGDTTKKIANVDYTPFTVKLTFH